MAQLTNCYDFPEIVVHSRNQDCPRYSGGICYPLPTPVEPYTEEEAAAVASYHDFMAGRVGGTLIYFHASGSTLGPGKEGKA